MEPFKRNIFSITGWRLFLRSLQHAHKEAYARSYVFAFSFRIVLLIAYIAYSISVFYLSYKELKADGDTSMLWLYLAITVSAILLVILFRRSAAREQYSLFQSLKVSSPDTDVPTNHRQPLAEKLYVLASLLHRAGSEDMLCQKELPTQVEVITRRRVLDGLTQFNLYDRLGDRERNLLLLPDGHWNEHDRLAVYAKYQLFLVLRWTLGLDNELPSLENRLTIDFTLPSQMLSEPETLFTSTSCQPSWEVRVRRENTSNYLVHILAECFHRNLYLEFLEDEVIPEWATLLSTQITENPTTDLFHGSKLIRDLDDDTLSHCLHSTLTRLKILEELTGVLTKPFTLTSENITIL